MKIFPAIDLLQGQVVRLRQGNYQQQTIYSDAPLAVAAEFRAAGAEYLHLVDLDGARDGCSSNFPLIRDIISHSGLKTEVGGGIRSLADIEAYAELGVYRVILGTAALRQPQLLRQAVRRYDRLIAVGVDIREGRVAVQGWQELAAQPAREFCHRLAASGVRTIICTDISRDGMQEGCNIALYRQLSQELKLNLVASGGISTLADLGQLAALGLEGAILGKALYSGGLSLAEALCLAAEVVVAP